MGHDDSWPCLGVMQKAPAWTEECTTVVKSSFGCQMQKCTVVSSSKEMTATYIVTEQNLQVKHATGSMPGQYVTADQCCFEADGTEH